MRLGQTAANTVESGTSSPFVLPHLLWVRVLVPLGAVVLQLVPPGHARGLHRPVAGVARESPQAVCPVLVETSLHQTRLPPAVCPAPTPLLRERVSQFLFQVLACTEVRIHSGSVRQVPRREEVVFKVRW